VLNSKSFDYFSREKIISLCYLIDKKQKISEAEYKETTNGIWSHEIDLAINWLCDWEIEDNGTYFLPGTKPRFTPFNHINREENDIIINVMLKYGRDVIK
jgi:hypothetical protein